MHLSLLFSCVIKGENRIDKPNKLQSLDDMELPL
jgi:hypothetical protein